MSDQGREGRRVGEEEHLCSPSGSLARSSCAGGARELVLFAHSNSLLLGFSSRWVLVEICEDEGAQIVSVWLKEMFCLEKERMSSFIGEHILEVGKKVSASKCSLLVSESVC